MLFTQIIYTGDAFRFHLEEHKTEVFMSKISSLSYEVASKVSEHHRQCGRSSSIEAESSCDYYIPGSAVAHLTFIHTGASVVHLKDAS